MELIKFQDYPSTETPLNAENLNHNFNEITAFIENINKAKTIILNGEWVNGVMVKGGATRIRLPIFNPTKGSPAISLTGQYYDGSTWVDVTNIHVSCAGTTFVELQMTSNASDRAILMRFYGTIQAE